MRYEDFFFLCVSNYEKVLDALALKVDGFLASERGKKIIASSQRVIESPQGGLSVAIADANPDSIYRCLR